MNAGANIDARPQGIGAIDELRHLTQRLPFGYPPSAGRRSIGVRAATSFPAVIHDGTHVAHCRAVELSASGVVVERGRELHEAGKVVRFEMFLPEQPRPIRVQARIVRTSNSRQALTFVGISDVDRLTLMEHVDRRLQRAREESFAPHTNE